MAWWHLNLHPLFLLVCICFYFFVLPYFLCWGGGGGCSHGWVPFTPPYPHLLNIDFLVIHWSYCITCFNFILVKFTYFWYQKYFSLISGGCNRDLLYPVCYLKCIKTSCCCSPLPYWSSFRSRLPSAGRPWQEVPCWGPGPVVVLSDQ